MRSSCGFLGCSLCWRSWDYLLSGCCDWIARTTSGIKASGLHLGFLRIRRARDRIRWRSCVDLRSEVLGVRGDRVSISEGLKEGSLNPWWSRSGEKLDLGFRGTGKNHIFICV